jgi:hypothetical protein
MKWFVLKDMLEKTYENLNKQEKNLRVNAMFGTDTLLIEVEIYSVIRLDMQTRQRTDTKKIMLLSCRS